MQLCRDISNELDKLSVWFAVNKLICNISKIVKFVLFADDTNIFCSVHDVGSVSRADNQRSHPRTGRHNYTLRHTLSGSS